MPTTLDPQTAPARDASPDPRDESPPESRASEPPSGTPVSPSGRAVTGSGPADPWDPRHHVIHHPHHLHAPSPGGSLVAGIAVYEVAAVTINSALDLDLLPTITGTVRRFRWSRVFGKLAAISVLAAMWATVATAAAAFAGMSARSRRQ